MLCEFREILMHFHIHVLSYFAGKWKSTKFDKFKETFTRGQKCLTQKMKTWRNTKST